MGIVCGSPRTVQLWHERSLKTDHHNKFNSEKKFELLWELARCDTETGKEQIPLKIIVLINLPEAELSQTYFFLRNICESQ